MARAYLAEHPADEDEPADQVWMRKTPWLYLDMGCWLYLLEEGETTGPHPERIYTGIQLNTVGAPYFQAITQDSEGPGVQITNEIRLPTRGEIRRLCAAHGNPLTEPTP